MRMPDSDEAKFPPLAPESQPILQLAFHTPLAFAVVDSDGRFIWTNRQWLDSSGLPQDRLLTRKLHEVTLSPDGDPWVVYQRLLGQVIEKKTPRFDWRVPGFFLAQANIPMSLSFFPILTVDKELFGIGILAVKMGEPTSRQQLMADALPGLVSYVNSEERYCFCNLAYERILGFKKDQIIGKTLSEILGPATYQSAKPYIDRALSGLASHHEKVMMTGQGDELNIVAEYIPDCDDKGDIRGFFIIANDMTEQRKTERHLLDQQKQFHILTNAIPSLISYIDQNMTYKFVNTGYESWFGIPFSQVIDQPVSAILGPAMFDEILPYLQRALNGERVKFERSGHYNGDTWRHVEVKYIPDFDADGKVRGIVSTVDDITELRRAVQRAEEAASARDEFISVASHELKTPLTSLRLQEQLIARKIKDKGFDSLEPKKVLQMLDNSERQTERLLRLVDDMLEMSRIVHGKFSIRKQWMDLKQTLEDCLQRLQPQLDQNQCAVQSRIEFVAGTWDRYRIEQIFINLMTNAIKYGPGQPIQIRLFRSGTDAIMEVQDNGVGIEPSSLEKIFERFERARSTSDISGLGMGLYIARELARAHDGDIIAKSSPGEGALFRVRLPLDN